MSRRPISLKRLEFMEFPPEGILEPDRQMEGLWYQLEASRELPIALVAVPGLSTNDVMDLAIRLSTVAAGASRRRVVLIDLTDVVTGETDEALSDLRRLLAWAPRGIAVARSPLVEPAAMPMIRAFDRVLLVTQIGTSHTDSLKATIAAIGNDRIVGTVCLNREHHTPMLRRPSRR